MLNCFFMNMIKTSKQNLVTKVFNFSQKSFNKWGNQIKFYAFSTNCAIF
jgi:hypothetical protein